MTFATLTADQFAALDAESWAAMPLEPTITTVTMIIITPSSTTTNFGGTQQFTATSFDQFEQPIAGSVVWSATGGTITNTGLWTAPSSPGSYTITASSNGVSGTATGTVSNLSPAATIPFHGNVTVDGLLEADRIAGDGQGIYNLTVSVPIGPNVPTGTIQRAYSFTSGVDGWTSGFGTHVVAWQDATQSLLVTTSDSNTIGWAREPNTSTNFASFEVEADLSVITGTSAGLMFNIGGNDDHVMLLLTTTSNDDPGVFLLTTQGGTMSLAASNRQFLFGGNGIPIRVLIRRVNNAAVVYVNGTFAFAVTLPSPASSSIGVTSLDGSARADNVRLYTNVDPYRPLGTGSTSARNVGYDASRTNLPDNLQDGTDLIAQLVARSNGSNSRIVSGGWIGNESGMTLTVSPAQYFIGGKYYKSGEQNITFAFGHATLDRYDTICLGTNGLATLIQGTPSATPKYPTFNTASLIELVTIRVPATTTQLSGKYEPVYREGSEAWSAVAGASDSFNPSSTAMPRTGAKCLEVTQPFNGDSIRFHTNESRQLGQAVLTLYIRRKESIWSNRAYRIALGLNGNEVGYPVYLRDGQFGLDLSVAGYQQVSIPSEAFGLISYNYFNDITITHVGSDATSGEGMYIDDFQISNIAARPRLSGTIRRILTDHGGVIPTDLPDNSIRIRGDAGLTTFASDGELVVTRENWYADLGDVSGNITHNPLSNGTAILRLVGNTTLTIGPTWYNDQAYNLIVVQGGTGGYSLTIQNVNFSADIPSISLNSDVGKYTRIGLLANPGKRYDVVALQRGFTLWSNP